MTGELKQIEVIGNRANDNSPGRLATAIVDFVHEQKTDGVEIYAVNRPEYADFLVYCRRTDESLTEAIKFCEESEIPMAFLSTGVEIDNIEPQNFPMIIAPNTALEVIGFMTNVEEAANGKYKGWTARIIEHHQESKKDTSGTAKKLASMLGIHLKNIISVRNFDITRNAYPQVPETSRDGYAVHKVTFTNPETGEISEPIEVVVDGRQVYAQGVVDIFKATQNNPEFFVPGRYDIVELVKKGIVRATSGYWQNTRTT